MWLSGLKDDLRARFEADSFCFQKMGKHVLPLQDFSRNFESGWVVRSSGFQIPPPSVPRSLWIALVRCSPGALLTSSG